MDFPRSDALSSSNFYVFIQAVPMGFSKVTSIECAIDTEPLIEGGINSYVHSLLKPVSTERTMVFERGVLFRPAESLLSSFTVGGRLDVDVLIFVMDRKKLPAKLYTLSGCFVKKWSCSDFDASSSSTLIERFEITYESIEVLGYFDMAKILAKKIF